MKFCGRDGLLQRKFSVFV